VILHVSIKVQSGKLVSYSGDPGCSPRTVDFGDSRTKSTIWVDRLEKVETNAKAYSRRKLKQALELQGHG
jgi:hypothetical protein